MRYLLILITLFLTACTTTLPGVAVLPTDPLQLEVTDFMRDWREAHLPDTNARCTDRELSNTVIHHATEHEWIDWLRLCPRMENGCSTQCGEGVIGCATGTVIYEDGAFHIFLSPGENSDGHRYTVRHEMAHAMSWCSSGNLDRGHHGTVWSSGIIQPTAQ